MRYTQYENIYTGCPTMNGQLAEGMFESRCIKNSYTIWRNIN